MSDWRTLAARKCRRSRRSSAASFRRVHSVGDGRRTVATLGGRLLPELHLVDNLRRARNHRFARLDLFGVVAHALPQHRNADLDLATMGGLSVLETSGRHTRTARAQSAAIWGANYSEVWDAPSRRALRLPPPAPSRQPPRRSPGARTAPPRCPQTARP